MQQFEDILLLAFCRRQHEPFIQDEEGRFGVLCQHILVLTVLPCSIQLDEQVREPNVLAPVMKMLR